MVKQDYYGSKTTGCIKAAQDILLRDYNNPMHAFVEDSFKVLRLFINMKS
jgi:hypothetical protein